jgi:alpha-L-fucosidase 2
VWYDEPTEAWLDGLPMGNGRMGAMVYGGVRAERLYLSETTFWSGEPPLENNNPRGSEIFEKIRGQLLARDIAGANELAHKLEGGKLNYGTNLHFGNLRLLFDHEEIGKVDYRRELDLDNAIVQIRYRVQQVDYLREVFISAPH